MSPAPHDKSNNSADFGANDWLIEEMRDQYQNDPSSVDPAWATFFHHEAAQASDEVTGSAVGEQPARQDPKP
ncbi:MAG: 2-oxoglutarate dehydrogenase E1 component, partial [Propionibacterium sp. DORA_15]